MENSAIHGSASLLAVKTGDEMYSRILWKFLPSLDGRIDQWNATHACNGELQASKVQTQLCNFIYATLTGLREVAEAS